jgi:hypothetical protein
VTALARVSSESLRDAVCVDRRECVVAYAGHIEGGALAVLDGCSNDQAVRFPVPVPEGEVQIGVRTKPISYSRERERFYAVYFADRVVPDVHVGDTPAKVLQLNNGRLDATCKLNRRFVNLFVSFRLSAVNVASEWNSAHRKLRGFSLRSAA